MSKTKFDEIYIYKISIKIQFFWCIYQYQNSSFFLFRLLLSRVAPYYSSLTRTVWWEGGWSKREYLRKTTTTTTTTIATTTTLLHLQYGGKISTKLKDAMCAYCQMCVSQESIRFLSWNFKRMLKGENHLAKRQFVDTTINTSTAAGFTTNTTSIVTTCKGNTLVLLL